jgi:hypothetical protein
VNNARDYERFQADMPVTVHALDDHGAISGSTQGRVRDLGEGGLSVSCDEQLPCGSHLVLEVAFDAEPTWFLGQVRYATASGASGFLLGVRFLSIPRAGPIADTLRRMSAKAA